MLKKIFLLLIFVSSCESGPMISQRVEIVNEIASPESERPSLLDPSVRELSPFASVNPPDLIPQSFDFANDIRLHSVKYQDVIGNQDSRVHRGETILLYPIFLNTGKYPSNRYRIRITCLDPLITPINPSQDIFVGPIPAGEVIEAYPQNVQNPRNGFQLKIAPETLAGKQFEVIFRLIDDLTQDTYEIKHIVQVQY